MVRIPLRCRFRPSNIGPTSWAPPRGQGGISRRRFSLLPLALAASACAQQGAGSGHGPASPRRTMRVEGTRLLSASGQPFVMRGINLQYGDAPTERLPMIDEIADTGANTIRLLLRRNTTAQELQQGLDRIVARGMVAVVMYWEEDVTCKDGLEGFEAAMLRWTTTWREVLSRPAYQDRLVLNIVNEWGEPDAQDTFGATYRSAIAALRRVGYEFPLMIDAAHCGQNYSVFENGGARRLFEADPLRNMIFSGHAYWSYQTAAAQEAVIAVVQGQGLAFAWGEFGQAAYQAEIGRGTDHRALIRHAEAHDIHYLAWSWYGNGVEDRILDMRHPGPKPVLTPYGREIVEGGPGFKGIRATALPLR